MITAKVSPTLSASTLKVFAECQRRYEYAYVAPRPWPAPANADQTRAEAVMEAGQALHQLIHLHARGHDPRPLVANAPELALWLERYLASPYAALEGRVFSEQALTLTVAGRKLVVKLDRLVHTGDRWLILDWKTARRLPDPAMLAEDWQARLYPYALVEAGEILNGGRPIAPESIDMAFVYLAADETLPFSYDRARHQAVDCELRAALAAIAVAEQGEMPPTGKAAGRCEKPPCKYYSLCHMAPPPPSEWRPEEADEAVPAETLQLLAEFEFDDEAVTL